MKKVSVFIVMTLLWSMITSGMYVINTQASNETIGFKTVAVGANSMHTAVLKSDGTVWTWGNNSHGQLGNGSKENSDTAVQVNDIYGVCDVAVGRNHSVALQSMGIVWTWGDNTYGALGCGDTVDRTSPVQVNDLNGVKQVAAGANHTLVLKTDGTVWAWGLNNYGQLGSGSDDYIIPKPVQVYGLSNIRAIAAGGNHSAALKSDGTVWTWGDNTYGQAGDGTTQDYKKTPVQVSNLSDVTEIAAGSFHTVALKSNTTVWAWGDNRQGQLGSDDFDENSTPVIISDVSESLTIDAGGEYTVALRKNGTLWSWGYNKNKELADGSLAVNKKPSQMSNVKYTPIIGAFGQQAAAGSSVQTVKYASTGGRHIQGSLDAGGVWIWHGNEYNTLPGEETSISLDIGQPNMSVNGIAKEIDPGKGTAPVIQNDRTLLPIRALAETIGGTVNWNDSENKVVIRTHTKLLELHINSKNATVNGQPTLMDVAPCIINDRTMLPLRFVAENLGWKIDWNDAKEEITILAKD